MKRIVLIKYISQALFILTIIAFLSLYSCKRYTNEFKLDTERTLEKITRSDYLMYLDEIVDTTLVLIDVRNPIEFEKGHLEQAINKYAPELLNEENITFFNDLNKKDKTIVLYGNNPNEVTAPFMLLYQLGYENIKMLSIENYYEKNELRTKNVELEHQPVDINAFIEESKRKATEHAKAKIIQPVKKVVPVKKKKKIPVEGGC